MTELLEANPVLPAGVIDVSVGEPHLVRRALTEVFDLEKNLHWFHPTLDDMSYPSPAGWGRLVGYLEEIHGSPVVVTNGAKQGLAACLFALREMGWKGVSMRRPYWALVPPLVEEVGMECLFLSSPGIPELCLAPNNPDGHLPDMKATEAECRARGSLLVHDAAYYTHCYLPRSIDLVKVGDAQVYSVSKMLGLSGLRLGYVVCPHPGMYRLVRKYMEMMTVGVGVAGQKVLYWLMHDVMGSRPDLVTEFEDRCRDELRRNKSLCLGINPEVLGVDPQIEDTHGMFGWFQVGPRFDAGVAGLRIVSGELFGAPGCVRFNLAFDHERMIEIVKKLNEI